MMKRKWTNEQKLEAIEEARSSSVRRVAARLNTDRKTVRGWMENEAAIRESPPRGYRVLGGGRQLLSDELEFLLYSQIGEERGLRRRVTRNQIKNWALELAAELGVEGFCASNGWLDGFLSRHNFVIRKATNKTKLDQLEIVQRAVRFIRHVQNLIHDHGVALEDIYNMDETAVFLDHSRGNTLEQRGAKEVIIKSYGFEKNRITAICCASASGMKKCATVIIPGSKSEIVMANGVAHAHVRNSWMNSDFFIQWIDFTFPLVLPWKTLLVFDSARSHISKKVKEHLQRRKILYAVIPGGMTAYLQPADHSWFKPFKDKIVEKIDEWKRAGVFEYTRGGNVRPPAPTVVSTWVKDAWKGVTDDLVIKSFERCFLGQPSELSIAAHAIYGKAFCEQMGCEVPPPTDVGDQYPEDGELMEDGEEFIEFDVEVSL
ncbi:hypothetical protein ATCC90586_011182 [Pythium insidiosum]|nr:hypothetical protein ATCC90586_011182 [Pythium insidiosum]